MYDFLSSDLFLMYNVGIIYPTVQTFQPIILIHRRDIVIVSSI